MTTIGSVHNTLQRDMWTIGLDWKDAYQYILINLRMKRFLAFQVGKELWQYTTMLFKLSIVPEIFNRLLHERNIAKMMVLVYLDDFLIVAWSSGGCLKQICIARDVLQEVGELIFVEMPVCPRSSCGLESSGALRCVHLTAEKALAFTD